MSLTLADLLTHDTGCFRPRPRFRFDAFEYANLQPELQRLVDADLLARLRWHIATEWQILAHAVRNCTSAADANSSDYLSNSYFSLSHN